MKNISISLAPNATRADSWEALRMCFRLDEKKGDAFFALRDALKAQFQAQRVELLTAGRWALYTLLHAARLQPDDEVLLQAYTCVSVPGPVLWAGLIPVYVDIQADTLTMDPKSLRERITPKSKILLLQHTFGMPSTLEELLSIAKEHNLLVIEDCAHTIGGTYHEKLLGTFGDAAVFSFGRDKAISSTFGGALAIHSPDRFPDIDHVLSQQENVPRSWVVQQLFHILVFPTLIRPLYAVAGIGKALLVVLQQIGFLAKAIQKEERRGGKPSVPYATLPEPLAHMALTQYKQLLSTNTRRDQIVQRYKKALPLSFHTPSFPKNTHPFLLRYTLLTPHAHEIRKHARLHNIFLGDWYTTVIAPATVDLAAIRYVKGSCPIAERCATESVNLPTHPTLSDEDIQCIIGFFHTTTPS